MPIRLRALTTAAVTMSSLALAAVVHRQTGSALIAGCEALFVRRTPPPPGRHVLRILLAAPLVLFFVQPGIALAAGLVAVATVGYGATLAQAESLVAITPAELSDQTLGVGSAARMTMQGVAAVLAGAIADLSSPAATISALAISSLAISLLLTPGLARATRRAALTSGP